MSTVEKSRAEEEAERDFIDLAKAHASGRVSDSEYLEERFDRGLAWLWAPEASGGRGLVGYDQRFLEAAAARMGCPDPRVVSPMGVGPVAYMLIQQGTPEQRGAFLKKAFTGEEVWCQLFSEADAGSDLSSLRTVGVPEDGCFVLSGKKVWSSDAVRARRGVVLAKTGNTELTTFILDMKAPGVEVRGIRQMTGAVGFAEVSLTRVEVPGEMVLGRRGWAMPVVLAALEGERRAMGGRDMLDVDNLLTEWRDAKEGFAGSPVRGLVAAAWEAGRVHTMLTARGVRANSPSLRGGEDALLRKVSAARVAKKVAGVRAAVAGAEALLVEYGSTDGSVARRNRPVGEAVLQAAGDSVAGGTEEVLLTVIGERILGLPSEK